MDEKYTAYREIWKDKSIEELLNELRKQIECMACNQIHKRLSLTQSFEKKVNVIISIIEKKILCFQEFEEKYNSLQQKYRSLKQASCS